MEVQPETISPQRQWRLDNAEKCRAARKKWNAKNKDKVRGYAKAWRARNPEKTREIWRRSNRRNWRKRRLLSAERVEEMLAQQGNCCAICKSDQPKTKKGWHIDHCHATGVVRGILCHACNIMLGNANDKPEVLHAAIGYLTKGTPP